MGRRNRIEQQREALAAEQAENWVEPTCPMCERAIPKDVPQSQHHLVPKSQGGRNSETVLLHEICQREIHNTLTEREQARNYSTIEALKGHPQLAKFFAWVAKRPTNFT